MRILTKEITALEGQPVELTGWVSARRDHGKLIFFDLRDRGGSAQVVVTPKMAAAYEVGNQLRPEWVVRVRGTVAKRPAAMVNDKIPTGAVEVQAEDLMVIAKAETPPIPLDSAGYEIDEEVRLKYRYLDLRRERLHKNIVIRSGITRLIRDFLSDRNFLEIETPILTRSTPEGARDYLVPSRISPGNFYALPQSPQQYKQLLMVAGFERYFQIARCFRDEDTRGDRQPEFTQLDMEMSFVHGEDVMALNEKLLIEIVTKLFPGKKIQETPFPRITYAEAMEKYKTDRPDLRTDKNDPNVLAFCWIIDFPFFEKTDGGGFTFTHNPFSMPKEEHIESLLAKKELEKILTTQYDVVLNGFEIGGGSIRSHRADILEKVFEIMGHASEKVKEQFGHMLDALSFGAPPHGGIAWGLDRLVAILQNEPNIREVMAFPKTGDGRDPMMGSPASVDAAQLKELGIRIEGKKL